MNKILSKQLGHDDSSGFEFAKEMLNGDQTAAVNFDRLQKHPQHGYIIMKYLLCEEEQHVTPYTSHPKKYWHKNATKFLSLWRAALDFKASLFLINYAKQGTKHEDEVLLIQVLDMDENGITDEKTWQLTRKEFSDWFRRMNQECLAGKEELWREIQLHKEHKTT